MKLLGLALLLLGFVPSAHLFAAELEADTIEQIGQEGFPFGNLADNDYANLEVFAKRHGVDLEGAMQQAYSGDSAALSDVFALSMRFVAFDRTARAYGNVLYSALLNFGESSHFLTFVDALQQQDPRSRQRVRDFLFYPVRGTKEAISIRQDLPTIFPTDYEFGTDDHLFD